MRSTDGILCTMCPALTSVPLLTIAVFAVLTIDSTSATSAPRHSPNPATTQSTQSGKPRPTTATMNRWDRWTQNAAQRHGFDWLLAKAVRLKESFNDPHYVSTTGAVGLMQLMPPSKPSRKSPSPIYVSRSYRNFLRARRARRHRAGGRSSRQWGHIYQLELQAFIRSLSQKDLIARDIRFDPQWNIRHGVAHLANDWKRFHRRYRRATPKELRQMSLAAYFAGPGRIRWTRRGIKLPSYTRAYVTDVLAIYQRLRRGLPGR